jgi:hypothetical protein
MASMTTTTTTYDLAVTIVAHVDNEGEPCKHCQLEDATVQVQAYITLGEAGVHVDTMLESCLACLVPALDSAPYLDTDQPIVVEVARSATLRPF